MIDRPETSIEAEPSILDACDDIAVLQAESDIVNNGDALLDAMTHSIDLRQCIANLVAHVVPQGRAFGTWPLLRHALREAASHAARR